jgi:hypothetical protein
MLRTKYIQVNSSAAAAAAAADADADTDADAGRLCQTFHATSVHESLAEAVDAETEEWSFRQTIYRR